MHSRVALEGTQSMKTCATICLTTYLHPLQSRTTNTQHPKVHGLDQLSRIPAEQQEFKKKGFHTSLPAHTSNHLVVIASSRQSQRTSSRKHVVSRRPASHNNITTWKPLHDTISYKKGCDPLTVPSTSISVQGPTQTQLPPKWPTPLCTHLS